MPSGCCRTRLHGVVPYDRFPAALRASTLSHQRGGPTDLPVRFRSPGAADSVRRMATPTGTGAAPALDADAVEVAMVTWPDGDGERARRLAADGVPRLLLVAGDAPPPCCSDELEDWAREPFDPAEVETRGRHARPAGPSSAPGRRAWTGPGGSGCTGAASTCPGPRCRWPGSS